jgi:NitT/TauT family transport system substrate-binding protein
LTGTAREAAVAEIGRRKFLIGSASIGAAWAGRSGVPVAAQTFPTVKLASAGIASDVGFFLALKKGYFRDEGLNVEMTQMANAPQMIGPLGMGQLDVGAGTVAASLYNAVAQNIALRAVADKGSMRPGYGFSGLLVRKDLVESGRFKSYADLKGLNSRSAPSAAPTRRP